MQIQEIRNNLDLSEKKQLYSLLKKDIGLIPQLNSVKIPSYIDICKYA